MAPWRWTWRWGRTSWRWRRTRWSCARASRCSGGSPAAAWPCPATSSSCWRTRWGWRRGRRREGETHGSTDTCHMQPHGSVRDTRRHRSAHSRVEKLGFYFLKRFHRGNTSRASSCPNLHFTYTYTDQCVWNKRSNIFKPGDSFLFLAHVRLNISPYSGIRVILHISHCSFGSCWSPVNDSRDQWFFSFSFFHYGSAYICYFPPF